MQSVKEWKNTKKYKNTKCIFCIFTKQIQKNSKKSKINTNAISQKYQIQKKNEPKNSKIQNTKKKYEPKISKYKIQKKILVQKWAREPTPCSFWKARTKLQNKCKANLLYFLNPANQILSFWVVFVRIFFVFLILDRRPFCSQRRLLNPGEKGSRIPMSMRGAKMNRSRFLWRLLIHRLALWRVNTPKGQTIGKQPKDGRKW